jgi:hypothetical protein
MGLGQLTLASTDLPFVMLLALASLVGKLHANPSPSAQERAALVM